MDRRKDHHRRKEKKTTFSFLVPSMSASPPSSFFLSPHSSGCKFRLLFSGILCEESAFKDTKESRSMCCTVSCIKYPGSNTTKGNIFIFVQQNISK